MQATKRESNAQTEAEAEEISPRIRIALKTALLLRRQPKDPMRMVAKVEIDDSETKEAHVAMTVSSKKDSREGGRLATSEMSSAERPSSSQSRSETP